MSIASKQFYENHASDYFDQTVMADMSPLYIHFLARIPPGGRILDVGCGSGRDLLAFVKRGFRAEGIDSSETLARMAASYSGTSVKVGDFTQADLDGLYDGIWACASLLHVERDVLFSTLQNLKNALVPGGTIFASVREGSGEKVGNDGRIYTLYGLDELKNELSRVGLRVDSSWRTQDVVHNRGGLTWINVLATNIDVKP